MIGIVGIKIFGHIKFRKADLLIGLLLLFNVSNVYSQINPEIKDRFKLGIGLSTFSQFEDGGVTFLENINYLNGPSFTPTFSLKVDFNPKYFLELNFEYSFLYSVNLEREQWLDNSKTLFQVGVGMNLGAWQIKVLGTGINHSILNTLPLRSDGPFNRAGPGLAVGYSIADYSISLSKDIVFDFVHYDISDFNSYISLRLVKFIRREKKMDPLNLQMQPFKISFGTELTVDHYSDDRVLSPGVYGLVELGWKEWAVFYKRSTWLRLRAGFTESSYYNLSSNLGLIYSPKDKLHQFGLSYLQDGDLLQRKSHYNFNGNHINRIYFIKGFSAHYFYAICSNMKLSIQLDAVLGGLANHDIAFSDAQLRFGLQRSL
ncbi:hypothetical protein [Croceimicrobium hydrocarbonivorans]|uniref:DUF4421 domain-containing protein n=1 Tax=Croceimicrobium hydrocarbonivorans TaxID=2761580 RepID=A0A7H0VH70_9FLAO|nr:hypothetical protein [Croceimicrobium hydrocarbonivorans]QNR25068.1 hypothetical protein H4K34_04260 [Croceimicrobium hydrocarbonivorans]